MQGIAMGSPGQDSVQPLSTLSCTASAMKVCVLTAVVAALSKKYIQVPSEKQFDGLMLKCLMFLVKKLCPQVTTGFTATVLFRFLVQAAWYQGLNSVWLPLILCCIV